MRTVLGKVVSLTGVAEVVDQHGHHVLLKAGDALHAGDQLITVSGAHVAMQAGNGEIVQFAEQQAIMLSDVLSASSDVIDISEYAVNPAVIQHLLAALQTNDALIELTPPLASMLQEDEAAFVSIAHASVTEQILSASSGADALNINDVLISGENQSALSAQSLPITQLADLMTQTSATVDIALPGGPLKGFLND